LCNFRAKELWPKSLQGPPLPLFINQSKKLCYHNPRLTTKPSSIGHWYKSTCIFLGVKAGSTLTDLQLDLHIFSAVINFRLVQDACHTQVLGPCLMAAYVIPEISRAANESSLAMDWNICHSEVLNQLYRKGEKPWKILRSKWGLKQSALLTWKLWIHWLLEARMLIIRLRANMHLPVCQEHETRSS